MKKILSLVMVLCMLLPAAVLAEEPVPVKTGMSIAATATTARNGGVQTNIVLTAVTVDDNGVIDACAFDYIQATIGFDAAGKLTTDLSTEFKSKMELGDAYGMRKASSIGAEWNEQAAAFAAYCTGKTLADIQGMELTENGKGVDVISSCTLAVSEFLPGLVDAVNNASHMGAKKGDTLKLVQVSNMSKSKDATATAAGQAQVYAHLGAFTLAGDVITSCYIDAVQATVKFDATGAITTDLTVPFQTKNEIKEGYGMKAISSIQKEWYEQAAGFCAFITGKTVAEAIAIAAAPSETDVVASCTIGTEDFLYLIVKAGQ